MDPEKWIWYHMYIHVSTGSEEEFMKTIFVSSTFRDMHYERDIIHERVTPALNHVARQYGELSLIHI